MPAVAKINAGEFCPVPTLPSLKLHCQEIAAVSAFKRFPVKFIVSGTQPFGDWLNEIEGVNTTFTGNGALIVFTQPVCVVTVSVGVYNPGEA